MKKIIILLLLYGSAFAQPQKKPLEIKYGGTGAYTAEQARANLGVSGSGIPAFPHDSTVFLRGDSSWQTVSGGGGVTVPLVLRQDTAFTPVSVFAIQLINSTNRFSPGIKFSNLYPYAGDSVMNDWYSYGWNTSGSNILDFDNFIGSDAIGQFEFITDSTSGIAKFSVTSRNGSSFTLIPPSTGSVNLTLWNGWTTEVPIGIENDTNTVFNLSFLSVSDTVTDFMAFKNGQGLVGLSHDGWTAPDYTLSVGGGVTVITYSVPPSSSDKIIVTYRH